MFVSVFTIVFVLFSVTVAVQPIFVSFVTISTVLCCFFKVMSVSVLYYCLYAFLFHCHSFNLSLFHLSPFLLSYVAVSRSCRCQYFTIVFVLFSFTVAVSTHLCVICHHFYCPMLLFQGHVGVSILLLSLCFSLSLSQFQPIFVSFVTISTVLCCCFKVMSVLVFYYNCLCAFLFHCRSFNPSLCHLSPFLLSYVAVSRSCQCWYFTIVFVLFSFTVAVSTHLCVICHHFYCPMLLFQGHVGVSILLLSLCFSLSLSQFQPIFVSFVTISTVLCCCFKVMSVSVFYYCLCAFLFHCRSFNPSLCHLSPFLLSYVAVSRSCRCQYFTIVFVLFSFTVAVSTHLCVICHHFYCPMLLFQGHVSVGILL